MTVLTVDEVMRRVEFDPNGGCWLWTGALSSGYGIVQRGRKRILIHRFMLTASAGDIPPDHFALHKCDVKCCVNPAHLYPGSAAANTFDTHTRLRNPKWHGSGAITVSQEEYLRQHEVFHAHWDDVAERRADDVRSALQIPRKEWATIEQATAQANWSTTAWVRRVLLKAARDTLADPKGDGGVILADVAAE